LAKPYTLLLIEPEAARAYEEANRPKPQPVDTGSGQTTTTGPGTGNTLSGGSTEPPVKPPMLPVAKAKSFFGVAEIPTATAKMRLVRLADEIVSVLASDPNANIRITVISAEFPAGASDTVKRAASENARSLGLKTADWE
jgi:uncharacterized protein